VSKFIPCGMSFLSDRTLTGEKLKSLREKYDLSQGQLAYLIGVRQPCIAKYEKKGVRNYWAINRIAIAFSVNVEDLW
jgi:DNA-binding XRE family transcriptional regulator